MASALQILKWHGLKRSRDIALAALKAQKEKCYLIQIPMPENFWTEAGSFAEAMAGTSAPTGAALLARVQDYVKALKGESVEE